MNSILILNGSPQGKKGNCFLLAQKIQNALRGQCRTQVLNLAEAGALRKAPAALKKNKAVIFITGTYWDSWGSPLQKFLEISTDLEGRPEILGKPAAVFVMEHSVGGKGVLSRLQGVLSSQGYLIPPMSGMVLSLSSTLALKNSKSQHAEDFWSQNDFSWIFHNLQTAIGLQAPWKAWPVDRKNFRQRWLR